MDSTLIISLLTVCIVLLSVVIVALLVAMITLLTKVRKVMVSLDRVANNVASATDWLAPSKVVGEIAKLFSK